MYKRLKSALIAALCAIALVALTGVAFSAFHSSPVLGAIETGGVTTAKELGNAFAKVAESASPAVVSIQVEKEMRTQALPFMGGPGMGPENFFEYFFGPGMPGMRGQRVPEGQERGNVPVPFGEGTGFILSPDGYIITNHHVVGDADVVRVKLADGREFKAKKVASDPQTEIALIKIDAENLPALPLGDSDNLKVGEWVLAIGSPFGLSQTVTAGIISARGRSNVGIVDYGDFIQTDAAINPGNSGGPLINLDGQVVGMNTAIFSKTGGSLGIGFAIPINMIKYVEKELRENGSVKRGYLGIAIQSLTPDLAEWFGADKEKTGVLVAEVTEGSPAAKAGLQRDDVIIEYDGHQVDEAGSFRSRVATTAPGKPVKLVILRGGNQMEKEIEIGLKTSEGSMTITKEGNQIELGLAVQNLTDDIAERLGYTGLSGVVVTGVEPGSAAASAHLKPGVLIQEVNRTPVHNTKEFEEALKSDVEHKAALLLVRDGEYSQYVTLQLEK